MSITYKELVEKGVLPGREIEIRVRHLVRTYYDVQKNRISIGNRVKVTEFINCPVCNVLIPKPKRKQWSGNCPRCGFEKVEVVKVEPEPILSDIENTLKKIEQSIRSTLEKFVSKHPLWILYLSKIKGIGPVLGAFLVTDLNPLKFETVGALYKYCGLHREFVCSNCGYVFIPKAGMDLSKCPACGKGPLVTRAPVRRAGQKIDWNPFARTMCWRIGESLRLRGGFYKLMFHRFYEELQSKRPDISRKHRLNDARRRVVKLFLSHTRSPTSFWVGGEGEYWEVGRYIYKEILGLPITLRKPYTAVKYPQFYIPPVIDEELDVPLYETEFYKRVLKGVLERYDNREQLEMYVEDLRKRVREILGIKK